VLWWQRGRARRDRANVGTDLRSDVDGGRPGGDGADDHARDPADVTARVTADVIPDRAGEHTGLDATHRVHDAPAVPELR
jgi:hypothetical protein